MTLEYYIVTDKFMSDLDGMYAFINEEVTSQEGEEFWEEPHQGLLESTEMDDVVDQENYEKSVNTYDQFVGAELCIPDEIRRKRMARVTKSVKDNEANDLGIEPPKFFDYH